VRTIAWRPAARRTRARALGSRDWAHAILERYLRRFARAAGGDRVFARPLTMVRDRWFVTARHLFPSIHLAIRPLLRPRLWQVHTTLATSSARTAPRLAESAPGERAPSARAFTRTDRVLARVPLNGEPLPREARRARRSPLAAVFQRLRDPEHAIGLTPARARALIERPDLVHTFTDRSRRLEHSSSEAPVRVVARRADAVDGPSRHGRSAADSHDARSWAAAGGDAPVNGSRRRQTVPPEPPVNIAALADRVMQQIDDRLHAWHERTGF